MRIINQEKKYISIKKQKKQCQWNLREKGRNKAWIIEKFFILSKIFVTESYKPGGRKRVGKDKRRDEERLLLNQDR